MTETYGDLDAALEAVVAAARAHLAAVKAAGGGPDDEAVWQAYVALNNASYEYDERINEVFGEVTPWDLEEISAEDTRDRLTGSTSQVGDTEPVGDAHPRVVSVRQRRDYLVPSVSALLRVAQAARLAAPGADRAAVEAVQTVGEAVLELLQAGDGSLGMLDVPELQPLDGLVTVNEVAEALDPDTYDETDGSAPFLLGPDDQTVARLDEHPLTELDDGTG